MAMNIFNRKVVLKDGTEWLVARRKSAFEWIGVDEKKKERSFGLEEIVEVKDGNGFGVLK